MILHITFTDGSNPWVSLPTDWKTAMKFWRKWSKVSTARPEFKSGKLKCCCDCVGNWYVAQWFDGAHDTKKFRYLANALKYMERNEVIV